MKLLILLSFSLTLSAQVTLQVPGNRVISLAGQPAGTRSANNARSAPADSPVQVDLPLTAGQALRITATGSVDGDGPDGRRNCSDSFVAEYSITRVLTLCRALVGVFLADTTRPQPAAGIDFTGDAREHIIQRPLLQQPFLIGAGLTSTGDYKAFVVPAGATRLFLAPVANANSTGAFNVTVQPAPLPETPSNPVRVSGISVIQLAGQAAGTASANNARIAPIHLPAQALVPLVAGQTLNIVATGAADGDGPDGRTNCSDSLVAENAIARVDTRCRALVGVFLADSTRAQPPNLNFTGALRNNARLEPLLQQPFLIGSGYTDAGEIKQFVVPAGATRLYFASVANATTSGAFTVTVSPVSSETPQLDRAGVVRAAGFATGSPSAGALVSLFGNRLAARNDSASSVPLPTQLAGTRVYFNLRPAPLFFAGANQVNAQVPWELASETTVQLTVVRNGAASLPVALPLTPASPGIFLVRENAGVIVNATTGLLVDAQSPIRAGEALVIYASGLGPVNANVTTGAPASLSELEPTREPVEAVLRIAGQDYPLAVFFAGSAPGFVGVNQVNASVPASTPAGVGILRLRTRAADSNQVTIAIER